MAQAADFEHDDELARLLSFYESHGRPLELEHWGEFVAVSQDGQVMLDADYDSLFQRAVEAYGSGVTFFKVGDIAVGSVRWLR